MKNNGFTLIELIMVILILGVIAIITVPTVNSIIRDSKQKAYDNQIKLIEDTTRTYMSKNSMELPSQSDGSSVCITVDNLKRKGFLSKDDIIVGITIYVLLFSSTVLEKLYLGSILGFTSFLIK